MGKKPEPQQYVVKEGPYLTVEFYYTDDGHIPASKFYESCSEEQKRRLLHIVEHLTDNPRGKSLPKTMFNEEDPSEQIYAIKPFKGRYLGFFAPGGKFVVGETYLKQTQILGKREKEHVKRTIERKKNYFTRVKAGDYYESK